MSEKIYILLPVHNRCVLTRRFIESLVRQDYRNYHLVLIDDGSTDGTEEMVRSYVKDVTVIRGKGDWWWGGALHQGYLWLQKQPLTNDDLVLIINDDTELVCEYLSTALDILRHQSGTLLISQCYDRHTKTLVDTGTHYMNLATLKGYMVNSDGKANCASSRGLFMRGTDMLSLGGFHPKLLPHYLSDFEYTLRAHKQGMKLVSDRRLSLYLDDAATGYHEEDYHSDSAPALVRKLFSKKSSANPVYWTSFILLACPLRSKLVNIPLLWANTFRLVAKQIFFASRPSRVDNKRP